MTTFISFLLLALVAFFSAKKRAANLQQNGLHLVSQDHQYGWSSFIVAEGVALAIFSLLAIFTGLGSQTVVLLAVLAGALALILSVKKIESNYNARYFKEGVISKLLLSASIVSVVTTMGILVSVLFEAIQFFQMESFWYFLFGTEWNADARDPEFGAVPLFAGTLMITLIALLIAVPLGLLSAIFTSEYASKSIKHKIKPFLEILAGIPTVVYGFFAAITIAPFIVNIADSIGLEASFNSALASGVVMGVMIIPIISSLSDDVINAIPNSMREGGLGLGLTKAEVIKSIVLPAALPGIISAVLLGFSRAVGETMIVVMAAGLRPNLTANPLEDMTTVTVRIVDALTGDQEFDSPETLSAFALGLVLFVVTLLVNAYSSRIIKKFKKKYEINNL